MFCFKIFVGVLKEKLKLFFKDCFDTWTILVLVYLYIANHHFLVFGKLAWYFNS